MIGAVAMGAQRMLPGFTRRHRIAGTLGSRSFKGVHTERQNVT